MEESTNIQIAQQISAIIGTEPIPFDSVYSLCLQIYQDLGGTEETFDDIYSILLETLPLAEGGGGGNVIDDTITSTTKTWSSSKINTELNGKQGALTAGQNIQISGSTINALGYRFNTTNGAFAEGDTAIVSGVSSHAEGYISETGGNYTSNTKTAGSNTNAGAYAHAEGNATIAQGIASHAEGQKTFAKGNHAHAEGNTTTATGADAHAEGSNTRATYYSAHAEGTYTLASGKYSHAEGANTEAKNFAEHASGNWNVTHVVSGNEDFISSSAVTIYSIGIGNSSRKNAVEVMQNGDMYINGIGGYDGVHISSEAGYSYTMTLQNMVVYLNDCIDTLTWQMKTIKPLQPNQIRYTTNDDAEFDTYGALSVEDSEFSNGTGIITFVSNLTTTGDYNFSAFNQDNLTSIELPKSEDLYRIDAGCFENQTNLKQFTIPINITEIGYYAFSGCSSLEILKYEGTMDMWGNISLGTDWYSGTLLTQVICLDGVVGL